MSQKAEVCFYQGHVQSHSRSTVWSWKHGRLSLAAKDEGLPHREHAAHGTVDGWGLMHALTADVVKDLLGLAEQDSASPTADAWMMVSTLATNPCRQNAMGEMLCYWHLPYL